MKYPEEEEEEEEEKKKKKKKKKGKTSLLFSDVLTKSNKTSDSCI